MTRDEAVKTLIDMANALCLNPDTPQGMALKMAIKTLGQELCEDTISRQAVIEQTYNWSKDEFLRVTNPFDYLRKKINSLPSVNPQKSPQHTKCDQCPYGEIKIVNVCNYDGDGCGWD